MPHIAEAPTSTIQPATKPASLPDRAGSWLRDWRAGLIVPVAGLAIAACSSGKSQPESPDTSLPVVVSSSASTPDFPSSSVVASSPSTLSPTATEISSSATAPSPSNSAECEKPFFPVKPRWHFKTSNLEDLQKQQRALSIANHPTQQIDADVVQQAISIVVDAGSDPVYAKVFEGLNTHPDENPDLTKLLNQSYGSLEGLNCLTATQVEETRALYKSLVDGLSGRVASATSIRIHVLYEGLKHSLDTLKNYIESN